MKKRIGGVSMNTITFLTKDKKAKRYCSVQESLEQSLKEMKLIRKGELKEKTWEEFKKELEKE